MHEKKGRGEGRKGEGEGRRGKEKEGKKGRGGRGWGEREEGKGEGKRSGEREEGKGETEKITREKKMWTRNVVMIKSHFLSPVFCQWWQWVITYQSLAKRDLAHFLFSPSDLCCIGSCFRGTVNVQLFSHGYLYPRVFHLRWSRCMMGRGQRQNTLVPW